MSEFGLTPYCFACGPALRLCSSMAATASQPGVAPLQDGNGPAVGQQAPAQSNGAAPGQSGNGSVAVSGSVLGLVGVSVYSRMSAPTCYDSKVSVP